MGVEDMYEDIETYQTLPKNARPVASKESVGVDPNTTPKKRTIKENLK